MAGLDAALNQAGYRDDGLPASFGPWANAWSPAWVDSSSRASHGQVVRHYVPLVRETQGVPAGDAHERPLSSQP